MDDAATLIPTLLSGVAYHSIPAQGDGAKAPGLIFLGGFRSDMTGTKALWLQEWARKRGQAFLRFDYRGHGASDGRFEDHCLGDWAEDAAAMLGVTQGQQILIGSSMGGWIALLLAQRFPQRVAGLVGIAAAPDFTERRWRGFSDTERAAIARDGQIALPSEYSDTPYIFTRRLFQDGRGHLVLAKPLTLRCPMRLLHGTADNDVPHQVALDLLNHAQGPDIRLTLVKDADHRMSDARSLTLLGQTLDEMTETLADC